MSKITTRILLSDDDKEYLKSLVRNRTIQAQIVDRSRILLSKSEGKADKAVADGLGISVNTVRRCVSRYNEGGVKLALFDDDRSGRPVEITDDAKAWIISVACQKPCDLGYSAELWTLTNLHKHIQAHAEEADFPRLKTVTKPATKHILTIVSNSSFSCPISKTIKQKICQRKIMPIIDRIV